MLRAWQGVLLPIGVVPLLAFWSAPRPASVAATPPAAPAGETLPKVILRLPDGTRTEPIADPRLAPGAVVLTLPQGWEGRTVDCCVHPLATDPVAGACRSDWQLRLPVDAGGHARIANLPQGRSSLHAVLVANGRVRIAAGELDVGHDAGPEHCELAEVPGAVR